MARLGQTRPLVPLVDPAGAPDPAHRTSLAVASATRHVGLALLVAAGAKGAQALPLVAGYLFASAVASIPYLRWRKRVHARG